MTLLFVDDDPPILRAMERMLRVHCREWTCHFTSDPRAALEFLTAVAPDAIVTDMLMPGMDGVEFLAEAARRRPAAARFILSGEVGAGAFVRMARSAHQCLAKPCRADVLVDVVRRALANGPAHMPAAMRAGLYRLTTLPIAAPSLAALRRAMAERHTAASDAIVLGILERDAGLAAKLLQVAAWVQVGLGPPPRHVRDAYAILGRDAVELLAGTDVVEPVSSARATAVQLETWTRAERAVLLASAIADTARLTHDDAGHAVLAALLATSAPLVFDAAAPTRYATLRAEAVATGMRMAEVERREFGLDAPAALARLLRLWGLPDPLCAAVSAATSPPSADGRSADLVAHLAYLLAHTSDSAALSPETTAVLGWLGLGARLPTCWTVRADAGQRVGA